MQTGVSRAERGVCFSLLRDVRPAPRRSTAAASRRLRVDGRRPGGSADARPPHLIRRSVTVTRYCVGRVTVALTQGLGASTGGVQRVTWTESAPWTDRTTSRRPLRGTTTIVESGARTVTVTEEYAAFATVAARTFVDHSTVPRTEAAAQFNGHAHTVKDEVGTAAAAGPTPTVPPAGTATIAAAALRAARLIILILSP